MADSISQLRNIYGRLSKPVRSTVKPKLALIFTGQGAQWYAMGRELMEFPVYKQSLQSADAYFRELGSGWSLLHELRKDKATSVVRKPALSQPICTAVQIALVELLESFWIRPAVVVGHSSGEIAAAYCIGAISAQSAWKLAYCRGCLAATLVGPGRKRGAMLSVGLSETEIRPYFDKLVLRSGQSIGIVIGYVNSPYHITVSGDEDQINSLQSLLDEHQIFT